MLYTLLGRGQGFLQAVRLQSDAFTAHMQQDGEQRRERKCRGRTGQMTRDVVGLRAGQMARDVVGLRAGHITRDVVALRVGKHAARPRSKAFRQLRASSRMHSRPTRAGCSRTVNNAGSGNQRILTDAANCSSAGSGFKTNSELPRNRHQTKQEQGGLHEITTTDSGKLYSVRQYHGNK